MVLLSVLVLFSLVFARVIFKVFLLFCMSPLHKLALCSSPLIFIHCAQCHSYRLLCREYYSQLVATGIALARRDIQFACKILQEHMTHLPLIQTLAFNT